VPRTPWRRRRTGDLPRPAGRRWAGRLRRGGSLARRVLLVRVRRHRTVPGGTVVLPTGAQAGGEGYQVTRDQDGYPSAPSLEQTRRRFRMRARRAKLDSRGDFGADADLEVGSDLDPLSIAPVSPAVPPLLSGSGRPAGPGSLAIPLLPGPRTPARRLRFAAVNACTLASLVLGLSAIFLSMQHDVRLAAACLVGCVTFDGVDGALARKLGVASPFGAQMDSLADMCSFGVAAPVVVYASIHHSAPTPLVAGACAILAGCAAIRLARFNVSPKDGRFFCGVPTTMTAAVLGLAMLIGLRVPGAVAVTVVAALGLAMVSSFPYAKLARLLHLPVWLWVFPLAGLLIDYRVTFGAVVVLYLASGPLLWLRQRRA
jgi:CDP-diacylglycerol--serine O-phosphatidyltransferase